jgi:hypothetical protein
MPAEHLPVALADHVTGNLKLPVSQCGRIRAYQTVVNNPCQRLNAELLLICRVDYTTRILCPLVLVVNVDNFVCTKICPICKEHL